MVSNSEVFTEIWSNVPQTVPVLRLFKISLVFRPHPHSRQSPRGDWNRPYFIRPQRVPLTRSLTKGLIKSDINLQHIDQHKTQQHDIAQVLQLFKDGMKMKNCWRAVPFYRSTEIETVLRRWMFHSLLMHWQSRLWLSGWQLVGLGPGSKKKRDNMVSATPTAYKDFKLEKWPICTNMLRTRSRVSCQKMKMWSHL